ncbi:MAG: OmpA family protein [Treponemataceae bacterium]|nr:OmpA family protein [Treponemataceae bacterium]
MNKKLILAFFSCSLLMTFSIFAQQASSQSQVDWTQRKFSSKAELAINKNGIILPSGRSAAQTILDTKIPVLLKDPLLALSVDSSQNLGDSVLIESISLDKITDVIERSKKTPPYYMNETDSIIINHDMDINEISAMLVKHKVAYTPKQTIKKISSRPYTGIIIDARGTLPVQGEFVSSKGKPCFFPKIWNESMDLIYEKNMVDSDVAKQNGVVSYHYSSDERLYEKTVGVDPLRITAKKIFGINRTDPVISTKDALKILSVTENRKLLMEGKVVILLDKENLIYPAMAPEKDESYYVVYRDTENFFYKRKIPNISVDNTYKGIQISVQDIKFMADSAQILPEEKERLDAIYEDLKNLSGEQNFSILIEGHTADVGKPNGQMNLSVERAKTIVDEMVKRGIPKSIFSYKGYGATIPIGDNNTEAGRAKNRRVEIILIPKATNIQIR